jgi:hypothetical protein
MIITNKWFQIQPVVWGLYTIGVGIVTLYYPSIWQGIFIGYGLGMFFSSFLIKWAWDLVEDYSRLTTKLVHFNKKVTAILNRRYAK